MALQVAVSNRDYTAKLVMPQVKLTPASLSWTAIGGPERAVIDGIGSREELFTLLDWLRCPVEIYDEYIDCVWWGYVHEVEVKIGAIEIGVSLDSMANSVNVAYTDGTERKSTGFFPDVTSADEYGLKHLLETVTEMTTTAATAYRDALLLARHYPTPLVRVSQGNTYSARLTCQGWWQTLGWQYYTDTGTSSKYTTNLISEAIVDYNQFLGTVAVETGSGITTLETRDGDSTYLAVIEELLAVGTSNNKRLLATVNQDRTVRIYEEPASTAISYYLGPDGRLYDETGTLTKDYKSPVGTWLKLKDVIPGSTDLSMLADPSVQFIERAEYVAPRRGVTLAGPLGPVALPPGYEGFVPGRGPARPTTPPPVDIIVPPGAYPGTPAPSRPPGEPVTPEPIEPGHSRLHLETRYARSPWQIGGAPRV